MLKARVVTALILIAGLLGILFALPPSVVSLAFAIIAALAAWEWAGLMILPPGARIAYGATVLGLCILLGVAGSGLSEALWLLSALFWLLLAPWWLRYRWQLTTNRTLAGLVGLLLTLPTWAAMVMLHQRGPWVLIGVMALVWVADIAAYFSGRAFGRHKLAPSISPGKTWEGVAGACVGTLIYAAIVLTENNFAWLPALPAVLLLTAVSVVGDLFESMAKREAGIKDSSNLLPGHGGVLDRIDSLTATLPLAALLLGRSGG
jgi:phosphatidate cytidylyltransferase